MDPRYTGEILKHLEEQDELLNDAHRSLCQELQKLQVEQEMLMLKFYELMAALGLTKRNGDGTNIPDDGNRGSPTAMAEATNKEQH